MFLTTAACVWLHIQDAVTAAFNCYSKNLSWYSNFSKNQCVCLHRLYKRLWWSIVTFWRSADICFQIHLNNIKIVVKPIWIINMLTLAFFPRMRWIWVPMSSTELEPGCCWPSLAQRLKGGQKPGSV